MNVIKEEKVVRLSGEFANQMFKDLEEWERILAGTSQSPQLPLSGDCVVEACHICRPSLQTPSAP